MSPYVLNSMPAVPSIGRRCMGEGYEFRRKAGQNPFLITPAGKKIVFKVDGYVSHLNENPDGDPGEASDPNVTNTAPAAAAIGTGSGSSSSSSSSSAQAPYGTASGGSSAVSSTPGPCTASGGNDAAASAPEDKESGGSCLPGPS